MNVLDLTGLVAVAGAALCTLWGVAGRVDRHRHRHLDTADADALRRLRATWKAGAAGRHAAGTVARRALVLDLPTCREADTWPARPGTVYVTAARILPALPAVPRAVGSGPAGVPRARIGTHSCSPACPRTRVTIYLEPAPGVLCQPRAGLAAGVEGFPA